MFKILKTCDTSDSYYLVSFFAVKIMDYRYGDILAARGRCENPQPIFRDCLFRGYRRPPCAINIYSETWELGTPTGLWKTVLNSELVLFLRSISVYWIGLGTGVAALNSQVVPISQVVLKIGFTVIVATESIPGMNESWVDIHNMTACKQSK